MHVPATITVQHLHQSHLILLKTGCIEKEYLVSPQVATVRITDWLKLEESSQSDLDHPLLKMGHWEQVAQNHV